jgi:TPR repeat protein
MVALLYETGLGVERDLIIAESWLIKAAAQDSPLAWNNLGTMYAMGHRELEHRAGDVLRCDQKAKELGFDCAEPYPPPYLLENS